jgi:hypothetical protein
MRNPLTQAIEAKFTTLEPLLDERARRLWAAVGTLLEALA